MMRTLLPPAAMPRIRGVAAAITVAAIAFLVPPKVQTLFIAGLDRNIRLANGDIITLRYTQSMYGVPVEEKFRVRDGTLHLFEISSTGAALEYLGIERHGKGNIERDLKEFSIPRASTGNHVLTVKGREIPLKELKAPGPSISVRIDETSQLYYLMGNIL